MMLSEAWRLEQALAGDGGFSTEAQGRAEARVLPFSRGTKRVLCSRVGGGPIPNKRQVPEFPVKLSSEKFIGISCVPDFVVFP